MILDIVARWPGSSHDAHIWNTCNLKRKLVDQRDQTSYYLIGDSAYPLEPWMLKPYADPQTQQETLFNEKLRTVRNSIERCNGVLKGRFRCLHESGGSLIYTPDKVCNIVMACAVLHNICITYNVPLPDDAGDEESEDDETFVEQPAFNVRGPRANQLRLEGEAVRQKIAEFLFNAAT